MVYKVVEQKKKHLFRGKIRAQDLENAINNYAGDGWTLDRIVAGETARFMGFSDKEVFLLILKK